MNIMRLKYWIVLLLGALLAGACSSGEIEDMYPVAPGDGNGGGNGGGEETKKEYVEDLIKSMVRIPSGTFMMGNDNSYAEEDEKPKHLVALDGFYISKYCVPQCLYREIMGENPSSVRKYYYDSYTGKYFITDSYGYYNPKDNVIPEYGDDFPVANVSYGQCLEFIKKLNQKTGLDFALPTEAQWELAARGAYATSYSSSSDYASSSFFYVDNGERMLHEVEGTSAYRNAFGLYHMSGNVMEWCADWYDVYPQVNGEDVLENPDGPSNGTSRVMRGGSCVSPRKECRVTFRMPQLPSYSHDALGFRLVLNGNLNLNVSAKKLEFERNGGTKTVDLKTISENVSYTSMATWCKVSYEKGVLSVTVNENTGGKRSTTIEILVSEEKETIVVEQEGYEIEIRDSRGESCDTLFVGEEGSSGINFIVYRSSSSINWTVSSLADSWCHVTKTASDDFSFSVTVDKNLSSENKIAQVIVAAGTSLCDTLWVIQEKAAFEIRDNRGESCDTLIVGGKGAKNIKFRVYPFDFADWEVTSLASSWCEVTKSGANDFFVTVSKNPSTVNKRTTRVVVSAGLLRDTLWVVQEKGSELFEILVDNTPVDTAIAESNGWEGMLTLSKEEGNTAYWDVECPVSWCRASRSSGSQIHLIIDPNEDQRYDRKTYIRAYTMGGDLDDTLWIVQKKKVALTLTWQDNSKEATVFSCKKAGGYRDCNVSTYASWTVESEASWCRIINETSRGFRIVVDESDEVRETNVIVDAEGVRDTITIEQNMLAVGDFIDHNGVKGIAWQVSEDKKAVKIVSLQETSAYWSYRYTSSNGYTYATSTTDGEANMSTILNKGNLSDWPVFEWCYNYSDDHKWYLPAKDELVDMFAVIRAFGASKFDQLLVEYGGDEISSASDYWSSTERDFEWAYTVNKSGTTKSDVRKNSNYRVRAIRKVTFD